MITITDIQPETVHLTYPVTAKYQGVDNRYTLDGLLLYSEENYTDLVELVTDTTEEYTKSEFTDAINAVGKTHGHSDSFISDLLIQVFETLDKNNDPQYLEFLRLKQIYEGSK